MKLLQNLFRKHYMRFKLMPPLNPEMLSKLHEIDEEKIANPEIAQQAFSIKHHEELSNKAEKRLFSKVLDDISTILEKEWCLEISENDLNHVHLCKEPFDPIFDTARLLSHTELLYHASEKQSLMPQYANRNIKSSIGSQPEPIPIDYEEFIDNNGWKTYQFHQKTTLDSSDLGWTEYGKIIFEKNPKGRYKLKDGTRLCMGGLLDTRLIRHINRVGQKTERLVYIN